MLKHIAWDKVPKETLAATIERRYVSHMGMTLASFQLKKGGIVGRHKHVNEQITSVFTGALKFIWDDGKVTVVGKGETLFIPSDVPHEVHVVEDADVLDIFIPERADWAAGTDNYFRK
jgi:unsaturated pyranuronate lyase